MIRQVNGPENECFICHRTNKDLETLFNLPLNQAIKQRFTELKKMQEEVIGYINQLLLPTKTYLFTFKKDLIDNQFKTFKISTIEDEYKNLKKQIPHLKEFCKYFGIDLVNYRYSDYRGVNLHLGEQSTLKELLDELEKDLEALEAITIPERIQNLLNLILEDDEYDIYDRGYMDEDDQESEDQSDVGIHDLRTEMKKYLQQAIKGMHEDNIEEEDVEDSDDEDEESEEDEESKEDKKETLDLERPKLSPKAKIIIKASFLMKTKLDSLLKQYEAVNFKLKSETVTIQHDRASPNTYKFIVKICPICLRLINQES